MSPLPPPAAHAVTIIAKPSKPPPPRGDAAMAPRRAPDAIRRHARPSTSPGSLAASATPREPRQRNVLRRRPSGSTKLVRARNRGMSSPCRPSDLDPRPSSPLTPASAVAEAYKHQQDESTSSVSRRRNTPLSSSDRTPSISDSAGPSLTRKVSARWRMLKSVESHVMQDESPSSPRERGHSKGRPSFQGIWKAASVRSSGQSIDSLSRVNTGDGSVWSSPVVVRHHARSGSRNDKAADGNGEAGSKLWRLMRRISTGGLRDRFQVDKENAVVPPVPAIPKELLDQISQGDRAGSEQPPSTLRHPSTPRNNFSNGIVTPARPSVATSSSIRSSDVSSSPFFSKTHSARSSVSSYGEALGGCHALDRHIIAPLEQLRLGDSHGRCVEPSTSTSPMAVPTVLQSPRWSPSVPTSLGDDDPLPLSSTHRQTCSGESPSRGSWRTSSPSTPASASGSPNVSCRQAHGLSSLSPPPPRRSLKCLGRGDAGGSVTSLPSPSSSCPRSTSRPPDGILRQMERMPSTQSNMTARDGDSTAEPKRLRLRLQEPDRGRDRDHDRSLHTATGAQFTFRELPPDGLTRRPPLSEQEKADIWNDLLARSDQAGGTLYIYGGAPELMSDSLRFSTYSEAQSALTTD